MNANRLTVICFSLVLLSACQSSPNTSLDIKNQAITNNITDLRLPEISGLAASNSRPSHLWAINDSGNSSSIYLIDQNLSVQQEIELNIKNRDWEDLAVFTLFAEAWVVIAESGDNLKRYDDYQLYFYREAKLLTDNTEAKQPDITLTYSYEYGSVNCEALAVDVTSESILFFTKTNTDTPVYRLPLSAMQSTGAVEAKLIATIPAYTNSPANSLISALTGVNLDATTGATISADGDDLFLLTYNDIWHIKRGDKSWQDALQAKAIHFASHRLAQAEAIASDSTLRKVLVTSEGLPTPVLRFSY